MLTPLATWPLSTEIELADQHEAFVGTTENLWEITRLRLLADVCDLGQALANSYAKKILKGQSLSNCMHELYSIKSTVPRGDSYFSLPIARGLTRLSTVHVTF